MRLRSFGNTGLTVSEIGFGCSRIGGVFAEGDDPVRLLRAALDAGINFFDTADMYAQGESEGLVGRAFAGRRDQVIIATKGGYCLPSRRKLVARVKPLVRPVAKALGLKRKNMPAGASGALSQDFSPAHLLGALEASLKRLRTDYVDLYQLHSPPPDVIRSGEWVQVLETLKSQGKIRHYGVACDTAADAVMALEHAGIAAVQLPFGLLDLEALEAALPLALERGVAVIARGCFGGGLMKESLTEEEVRSVSPKAERILRLRAEAASIGRPLLELALKYALEGPAISTAILGMRTQAHLAANLDTAAAASNK